MQKLDKGRGEEPGTVNRAVVAPPGGGTAATTAAASQPPKRAVVLPVGMRVCEKIGQGTFSEVFRAEEDDHSVALKCFLPTSHAIRIYNEIRLLRLCGGKCNVAPLLYGWRQGEQITIALPHYNHTHFRDFLPYFTVDHVRRYMHELFVALQHIHRLGIVHRDIKPGNFLFNFERNEFALIDFGLAETQADIDSLARQATAPVGPGAAAARRKQPSRAGTRGFRAPEVLLKCFAQSAAIDVWAGGVILLCLFSGHYPFFDSPDDLTALVEIASVFGKEDMVAVAARLGKRLVFSGQIKAKEDLRVMCNRMWPQRPYALTDAAMDFLRGVLALDPSQRLTAAQALAHPFLAGLGDAGLPLPGPGGTPSSADVAAFYMQRPLPTAFSEKDVQAIPGMNKDQRPTPRPLGVAHLSAQGTAAPLSTSGSVRPPASSSVAVTAAAGAPMGRAASPVAPAAIPMPQQPLLPGTTCAADAFKTGANHNPEEGSSPDADAETPPSPKRGQHERRPTVPSSSLHRASPPPASAPSIPSQPAAPVIPPLVITSAMAASAGEPLASPTASCAVPPAPPPPSLTAQAAGADEQGVGSAGAKVAVVATVAGGHEGAAAPGAAVTAMGHRSTMANPGPEELAALRGTQTVGAHGASAVGPNIPAAAETPAGGGDAWDPFAQAAPAPVNAVPSAIMGPPQHRPSVSTRRVVGSPAGPGASPTSVAPLAQPASGSTTAALSVPDTSNPLDGVAAAVSQGSTPLSPVWRGPVPSASALPGAGTPGTVAAASMATASVVATPPGVSPRVITLSVQGPGGPDIASPLGAARAVGRSPRASPDPSSSALPTPTRPGLGLPRTPPPPGGVSAVASPMASGGGPFTAVTGSGHGVGDRSPAAGGGASVMVDPYAPGGGPLLGPSAIRIQRERAHSSSVAEGTLMHGSVLEAGTDVDGLPRQGAVGHANAPPPPPSSLSPPVGERPVAGRAPTASPPAVAGSVAAAAAAVSGGTSSASPRSVRSTGMGGVSPASAVPQASTPLRSSAVAQQVHGVGAAAGTEDGSAGDSEGSGSGSGSGSRSDSGSEREGECEDQGADVGGRGVGSFAPVPRGGGPGGQALGTAALPAARLVSAVATPPRPGLARPHAQAPGRR